MISNDFQNSLKFSRNAVHTPSNGILNQNPIIITKTNAYNFNYTDSDKLRLAQLLAKRDIKNTREDNIIKLSESNLTKPVTEEKSDIKCKKSVIKKPIRERVSSIKRVPGPQTPNKIVSKKNLPMRSVSPPTRDNNRIWRPQPINDVPITAVARPIVLNRHNDRSIPKQNDMAKLHLKVDECTNKLDGLQRHLQAQSSAVWDNGRPPTTIYLQAPQPPVKSNAQLSILSDKLRDLLRSQGTDPHHTAAPSGVDLLLTQLDRLVCDMRQIESRWGALNYENVSVCSDDISSDDDDDDGSRVAQPPISDNFRFTKPMSPVHRQRPPPFHSDIDAMQLDATRIVLDLPNEAIMRLDGGRLTEHDSYRCFGIPLRLPHVDWLSVDLVDQLVDEIVDEINEVNNQLVEAILNSELDE